MIHVDAARRSLENVPTVLHFFWGTNVHQVTIAMPLPIPGSRWNCRNTFCRQTNCRTPRWRWHGWNRNESKPVIEPKLAKMRQQAAAWKTRALQNVFSHPKMCSPMPFQSYKMFSILNPLDDTRWMWANMRPTKCNSTIKIRQVIAQKRNLQNAYRLLLDLYEPIISYKKQATASHFSTKWMLQNHL